MHPPMYKEQRVWKMICTPPYLRQDVCSKIFAVVTPTYEPLFVWINVIVAAVVIQ